MSVLGGVKKVTALQRKMVPNGYRTKDLCSGILLMGKEGDSPERDLCLPGLHYSKLKHIQSGRNATKIASGVMMV